ncbi:DUF1958 domain-containing protein [Candidatus Enterococcus mansonii]|uniref:Peptidase S11 D-alanyl-D-alanine carboxypeptidase A N-terminal domain-containing protein n=1 Tax=Candidatus Enterococcus mansonii TaxID=1834181 RepID=A0A242CFD3_9ENTE|nr:DUF1958 domain-containing protein [Enterococcus sp. 4G2_DIV0659]OTO08630.1 hypothetical protein A5880_001630 [Enterococcus sp. 4G2_DIV0659]
MIKKELFIRTLIHCLFIGIILLGSVPQKSYAQENLMDFAEKTGFPVKEGYKPKSSIVIDATSGQILWEDQPDLSWSPASIAKVMTMYLAFEAMEQGKFTLDTTITATEKYVNISQIYALSNNKISLGVEYPVRDIFSMIAVPSSNVATLMLANLVSDNDETAFINKMNEKAAELGMTNTTYYNSSGAQVSAFGGYYNPEGIDPDGDNKSTARDLAILTYSLIKKYPDVLQFTNKPVVTTMKNTPQEETFETYNYSLPGAKYGYEGVDGLKTGSSPTGGFNYIATAKRGDTRLIEVILGVGDWADQEGEYERHLAGNAILDHAFTSYEYKKLLSKGANTVNNKNIQLDQDVYGLVKKGTKPTFTLDNGKLSFTGEFGQVSDKIPAPSINYQEAGKTDTKKDTLKETKNNKKTPAKSDSDFTLFDYAISGLLATLGVLFLILSRVFRKRVAGTRRGSKKTATPTTRLLFTCGALLLLASIGFLFFL